MTVVRISLISQAPAAHLAGPEQCGCWVAQQIRRLQTLPQRLSSKETSACGGWTCWQSSHWRNQGQAHCDVKGCSSRAYHAQRRSMLRNATLSLQFHTELSKLHLQ